MKKLLTNKKGGVVTDTVYGVGLLVIIVIVVLVITSTIITSNLFEDRRLSSAENNQTTLAVNETGVTLSNSTVAGVSCTVVYATNSTGGNLIPATNYSVDASLCRVTYTGGLGSGFNNTLWNISYTFTYDGIEEVSINTLETNFTDGINNISSKIPTILLIVAVVFLFGALVLLVAQSRRMGIGGVGSL